MECLLSVIRDTTGFLGLEMACTLFHGLKLKVIDQSGVRTIALSLCVCIATLVTLLIKLGSHGW